MTNVGFHRVIPRLWMMMVTRRRLPGYRPVTPAAQLWTNLWTDTRAWWVLLAELLLAGLVADPVGQLGDLVVDRTALGHQLTDLAVGVHDRGVVAPPEELADLG